MKTVAEIKELLLQWDFERNLEEPTKVAIGSPRKFYWKCKVSPDHRWMTSPNKRFVGDRMTGCPYCCNKKVSVTNSLEANYPAIAKEWHPTKNGESTPANVTVGHTKSVWWQCAKLHEFKTSVSNRVTHSTECPKCIPPGHSLKETFPQIAREWDYSKNDCGPEEVYGGAAKIKRWWKCIICSHSWQKEVNERTRSNRNTGGCPKCRIRQHSKDERYLRFELQQFFNIAPEDTELSIDYRIYYVDMLLPDLKLAIEYDGSFFHKDKVDTDTKKTKALMEAGWQVIRIRECSKRNKLDLINTWDMLRPTEMSLKEVSNKLLIKIKEMFSLNIDIDSYVAALELVNKDKAEAYILEQKIKKHQIKELANDGPITLESVKQRILELSEARESNMAIKQAVKEEFDIKLDLEELNRILVKYRKGLFYQDAETRNKIEERILKLADDSVAQDDIARQIETEFDVYISQITISRILRKNAPNAHPIKEKKPRITIPAYIEDHVQQIGKDDLTILEMIENVRQTLKFEISQSQVSRILMKAGLRKSRLRKQMLETVKARAIQLESTNITQPEIREILINEFNIKISIKQIRSLCRVKEFNGSS